MEKQPIRRKLGWRKYKYGELNVYYMEKPKRYLTLDIFADCETYYNTEGVEPWNHFGKPNIECVLGQMTVVPFILTWQYKRQQYKYDKVSKTYRSYEVGGLIKKNKFTQTLNHLEEFLIDLSRIYNEWKYVPFLYFHNATYDLTALEPHLKKLDPDLNLVFEVNKKDKRFIKGYMQSKKYNFYCSLGDTMKYDSYISIEKAGEVIGKPKKKGVPYVMCDLEFEEDDDSNITLYYKDLYTGEERSYPLKTYLEYAEMDVDIMREYHNRKIRQIMLVNEIMISDYDKRDLDNFKKIPYGTRAAHSKKLCNIHLMDNGWGYEGVDEVFRFNLKDVHSDNYEKLYNEIIVSNHGGFTSCNRFIGRYDCDKDRIIKYFDRNSMYPTIMRDELPYGSLLWEKPTVPHVTWYVITIKESSWKGVMECLKTGVIGKTKQNDMVSFFILKEYFEFIRENADLDYTISGTYYQHKTRVLREQIDKYYNKRKEVLDRMSKLDRNDPNYKQQYEDMDDQQKGLKLLMNSLYGKMCEKAHHMGCIYHEGEYKKYISDWSSGNYPCILTGSYIIYKARLELLRKIKAVCDIGWDFLYADTDSVIFGCPKTADPSIIFGVDNGNLGEWKEEGSFHLYLSLGVKKKYVLLNRELRKGKMALSGVNGSIQKIFKNKVEKDFERAERDLSIIFNPQNNVLLKRAKKRRVLTKVDSQPILWETDFQMNSENKRKVTHVINFTEDDYTITNV